MTYCISNKYVLPQAQLIQQRKTTVASPVVPVPKNGWFQTSRAVNTAPKSTKKKRVNREAQPSSETLRLCAVVRQPAIQNLTNTMSVDIIRQAREPTVWYTRVRNPLNVGSVERRLLDETIWKVTQLCIQQENHLNVTHAEKRSVDEKISTRTYGCTQVRGHLNVASVEKRLLDAKI